MKEKKSVLIVGANSLLSISIIKQLQSLNKYVFNILGVFNSNSNNIKNLDIELISYNEYLTTNRHFDFVFIIAAHIPYNNTLYFDENLINKNIALVSTISEKNKDSKLIFCSSVSVYGTEINEIFENTTANPETAYAISKLTGEFICKLHKKYSIMRLSSIYGKGINTPTFIPRAITQSKEKKAITLFGEGSRKQNYIHIKDAANYLIKAAFYKGNGVFLGTSKKEYSNLEISNLIVKHSTNNTKVIFEGEDNSKDTTYNCKQTIQTLKVENEISIEEGIKEMMI